MHSYFMNIISRVFWTYYKIGTIDISIRNVDFRDNLLDSIFCHFLDVYNRNPSARRSAYSFLGIPYIFKHIHCMTME